MITNGYKTWLEWPLNIWARFYIFKTTGFFYVTVILLGSYDEGGNVRCLFFSHMIIQNTGKQFKKTN